MNEFQFTSPITIRTALCACWGLVCAYCRLPLPRLNRTGSSRRRRRKVETFDGTNVEPKPT